jgi:hypothetical protein
MAEENTYDANSTYFLLCCVEKYNVGNISLMDTNTISFHLNSSFSDAPSPSGPGPPLSRDFYITLNDALRSVRLFWTNDQLVAETYTRQHTTLTRDKHPCPRWDSNAQS